MDPATALDNTDRSDRAIRLAIYRHFAETGQAPTAADVARALDQSPSAVEDAYRRLAAGRAIVLAPGTSNIWMAHPFSASPTPYRVRTPRGAYWANCAWDALNIAALLGVDAHVNARCPDCNDEVALVIRSGTLQAPGGVIHFAVPPRHFWENIGFT